MSGGRESLEWKKTVSFQDIAKAFDRVEHEMLIYTFILLQVPL